MCCAIEGAHKGRWLGPDLGSRERDKAKGHEKPGRGSSQEAKAAVGEPGALLKTECTSIFRPFEGLNDIEVHQFQSGKFRFMDHYLSQLPPSREFLGYRIF